MDEADPIESGRKQARGALWVVLALALVVVGAVLWAGHAQERDQARRAVSLARFGYRLSVLGRLRSASADETSFMEACRKCASAQECERDRLVIRSGLASDDYNPCD